MKKLVLIFCAALTLAACAQKLDIKDIKGGWSCDEARIYLNSDQTYELVYENPKQGDITSESGKYELEGKKIRFFRRDKYTLTDTGEVHFERLIKTENRKEEISLSGGKLTIGETTFDKQEE